MKVLIFNDTRIEPNPGCQATVSELSSFINLVLPHAIIEFKELGYGYQLFGKSIYNNGNLFKRATNKILRIIPFTKSISFQIKKKLSVLKWKNLALNNLPDDLREQIHKADLVIINMEGTIHHDSIGGLALLAYAFYSKSIGKSVCMVNGSYQSMNQKITQLVLPFVDFLSVRDLQSSKYLNDQNVPHYTIPDFAFNCDIHKDDFVFKKNKLTKYCLYTSGVLAVYPNVPNGIPIDDVKGHIKEIRRKGYEPVFLKIEDKENFIESSLKSMGVKSISYIDGLSYSSMASILNNFDILITGRYHIGIFGLMNYTKTYFMPSNTYKIEGMLDLITISRDIVITKSFDIINAPYDFEYNLPNIECFSKFKKYLIKTSLG